ncbi:MAG: tripartite tricarboxylate transporter TctB family protein [Burkholderiales bacterium]|nr:tripartite tricarboxylate transporter TctB family protein [Burkholderiales bacterium]
MKPSSSDRVLGAACALLGLAMAWAARDYAAPISYEPVGPRAFPQLLGLLLAACGGWMLLRPGLQRFELAPQLRGPVLLLAVAVLGYAALFEWLGFPLATAAMGLLVGVAFGGRWWLSLAGGLGLGLALYLMFDKLLDVVLPTGLLSFALGGR